MRATKTKIRTGAVILAAGQRDSFPPLLPVGDSTVIRRAVITFKRMGIDPIVIITGYEADRVEKNLARLGTICLRNERYMLTDMFSSICLGLKYIENMCERVLITPVKFPMLSGATIQQLLVSRACAAIPVHKGQRGHPVVLASNRIKTICAYTGVDGLSGALRQAREENWLEEIEVDDAGIIFAVDTHAAASALAGEKIDIHPQIQLSLRRDNNFFDSVTASFLRLIDHTSSMQTSCKQMGISYTKGWQILKNAERQLGFELVEAQAGGVKGGFTKLTPRALDLLNRYSLMQRQIREYGDKLFKELF